MNILDIRSTKKNKTWKRNKLNALKDFSIMNVSSHDVCMLLWYLYKKHGFYHITYTFENNRCYLNYISDDVPRNIRTFFDDRSNHEVEKLARKCGKKYINITTCDLVEYAKGFISPEVFHWKEIKEDECKEEESGRADL